MKDNQKAQFYIISAVIIIFIIMSLVSVSNYVSIKQQPEKTLSLTEVLKTEGEKIVENAEYTKGDINSNIESYLELFKKYIDENTQEDLNLVILYGDVNNLNNIQGQIFTRASTGAVNLDFGGQVTTINQGSEIKVNPTSIRVDTISTTEKTITLTIEEGGTSLTATIPILEDNNFVFVMTTSDGFNRYVKESFPTR
ncbi:MAG: hypothetical protein Q8L27_03315 [archaeon]|nr:hypothetical protein [archaeon]